MCLMKTPAGFKIVLFAQCRVIEMAGNRRLTPILLVDIKFSLCVTFPKAYFKKTKQNKKNPKKSTSQKPTPKQTKQPNKSILRNIFFR